MTDPTIPPPAAFNQSETYALTATPAVVRGSDGAHVPADPANADWRAYQAWLASGKTAAPAPVPPFDPTAVSAECQRRIYAVASQNCQMNMTAYVASGRASDADKAAFTAALEWVQAMREAFASLAAAHDATFADDAHWPACPVVVVALAARF